MGSKLKNFLFPSKEKNEFDSTTIVITKEEVKKMNNKTTTNTTSKPNIFTPKIFAQVEEIANELLAHKSVIVDLTSTDLVEAKRICDFLNGVSFALNGSVEKVAKLVYLFTPR